VSASVNLPLHHKVQKFSSGTGSPGWSRKKGRKTVVVWWSWSVSKTRLIFTDGGDGVLGVLESHESKLLLMGPCVVDEPESHGAWQDAVSDASDDVFDEAQRSGKRLLIVVIGCVDYEH